LENCGIIERCPAICQGIPSFSRRPAQALIFPGDMPYCSTGSRSREPCSNNHKNRASRKSPLFFRIGWGSASSRRVPLFPVPPTRSSHKKPGVGNRDDRKGPPWNSSISPPSSAASRKN